MRLLRKFLIVPAVMALAACGTPKGPKDEAPRPVRIATVGDQGTKTDVVIVGVVRAAERAALSFPVAGRIDRLVFEVGDTVAAGQVIATLDVAPFDLRARQARAEAGRARAVLTEAEGRLNRQQRLVDGGWVAPVAVDAVRAETDAARGGLDAALAGAALAQRDASLSRLRAPFSGRIAKRPVDAFAEVQPGMTVFEIDGAGLEVVAPAPATWAGALAPGAAVAVRAGERTLSGIVKEIAPRAGEGGSVDVIVTLPPRSPVRPGAAVRIIAPETDEGGGGLVVPFGAVLMTDQPGRGRVFVVTDGKAQPRAVRIGRLADDQVEIISGLKTGEVVVTAGARFLTPDQRVTPTPERTR